MALRQLSSSVSCGLGLKRTVAASLSSPDLWSRAFSTVLDGFKYAKSHEWAHSDGSIATVGISDHAQAELGDVVYVELPEVGKVIKKGDAFGVVESVKAASDVYSPISGEVVEVNSTLNTKPGSVNTSPFADGWIIKIKLSDKSELDLLMDSEAYKKEIEH